MCKWFRKNVSLIVNTAVSVNHCVNDLENDDILNTFKDEVNHCVNDLEKKSASIYKQRLVNHCVNDLEIA